MQKLLNHAPAVVLAAFLALMGFQKFGAENAIFATIAQNSGIAVFEPAVRIATGVAELIAAGLLLWPATRFLGALAGTAIIGGAILFHLSPWLGISVRTAPDAAPTPVLFFMALGAFALALFVGLRSRTGR